MRCIGIFGGTFNPIHLGHLRLAEELATDLNFAEVCFIPSANPPHKSSPSVSAQQRAEMVSLSIQANPKFKLDMLELERNGASYTIDTLKIFREKLGVSTSICLIMGSDAFARLDSWHEWQTLIDYCHIVLVPRPNAKVTTLSAILEDFLNMHYTENQADLSDHAAGFITMQTTTALDISSTQIRSQLAANKSIRYLVPENLLEYINQHHLYTSHDH